jgi:lysozyme
MARMSASGLEQLIADEGEVLTAYRDVVGVWTIGVGLTAASGVVKPKAGMQITRAESRALLAQALQRNYEPAVAKAMPAARQHEFDGGASFHFNTGAIGRASWVKAWKAGNGAGVRSGLMLWNKAGGKVVAGLTARRQREADLILDGRYAVDGKGKAVFATEAVLKRGSSGEAVKALQRDLTAAGFVVGVDSVYGRSTENAVKALQRSHPNLIVDGVAGPATRAALTRTLDLGRKAATQAATGTVATAAVPAADAARPEILEAAGISAWVAGSGVVLITLVALGWLAWRYRDEIRARFNR